MTIAQVLAADPLLSGGIGLAEVLIVLLKTLVAFGLLLVSVILMIWFERKVIGDLQNRVGPNKAGPWGLLQTLADGLKLIMKEDLIPARADRRVFVLAPFLSAVPAFVTFAVVPIGGGFDGDKSGVISLFGHDTYLQLADPPIGVLLVLAMSSIAVYGVMLAGWSSGSKWPLVGAVRGTAQMVSYEAALSLAVVSVVLLAGSLSTHDIVATQAGSGYDLFGSLGIPRWNIIATGVVPFVIFLVAATAELNRPPFDLVEAEQELVGGFHTEYSSFRFALFYLAEFMNTITMSAIIVTLFFGGPAGPVLLGLPGWLWGIVWFSLKLFVFLFVFVWIRATLPRFRYDQLMTIGWRALIPLALGWVLVLAAINIGRDEGWNMAVVVGGSLAVLVAGWVALTAAVDVSRERRLSEEAEEEALV
ncbi:MAG TPA: NADH-quinone oxidoreductase subunit NuoH [Acidimicrobiales bacterium]|nr:NADH-quinone oxidoreductase subunit NuoH [Acidimicrobiales bacterium]HEU0171484.1 NADH-quinone oxidoreductase subunit NuoH [Acidimicrobiales bacterium]